MRKKLIFLTLFIIFYTTTHAQYAVWMMGTWKSRSETITSGGSVADTIRITDVSVENFTGTKTIERNDGAKITISISGGLRGRGLYLQNGAVVHKERENSQWPDCSSCTEQNKIIISRDSLILIDSVSGCDNACNGVTVYYRLLSEYDESTQLHLVDRFGRPSDIIGFRPYTTHKDDTTASDENNETPKTDSINLVHLQEDQAIKDSLNNLARIRQQQKDDAARLAQQKKRQQEINDSLNLAKQKQQQRNKDSLDAVARIRQQQIDDSTKLAQQKKRQQEINDSLNLVKQKEQQRIKDSLDAVARIRQQQINDSTLFAQQKKRQQEINDSLNVKQKEQLHIKDSLDAVARIRQQQIDDSTKLVQQKKRQQEINDSLNLVKQKEELRIKDSLDNVARLEQIKLRTEDSLRNIQAKKRQQEIEDSLSLANQKRQQHINDSLQLIAASNLQKQRTADSLREAQARKKQQEITDSLAAVRKQQYNDSLQKIALTKAAPKPTTESSKPVDNKALTSRTNVLLQTYHITSPDILIELFDNGEIDSDRVSVFHNNSLVISNQVLGTKAITLNVHADTSNREHEFVLVAENLGSIPPNSALMRITAGKQTYKLSVNTDMKTNARIVFYYDGN